MMNDDEVSDDIICFSSVTCTVSKGNSVIYVDAKQGQARTNQGQARTYLKIAMVCFVCFFMIFCFVLNR